MTTDLSGETDLGQLQLLTVKEVAAMMRVSTTTVYRLVYSGQLPTLRLRRSLRVSREAMRSYLRTAYHDAG